MIKPQIKVLGIDDGPFDFSDSHTPLVGVVIRAPSYIEGVLRSKVEVDGTDANSGVINMVNSSGHKQQLKAIMLDGVAFGGFNVVDIEELYRELEVPMITITRDNPDLNSIKEALKNNFDDWERRWKIINRGELIEMPTNHNPIYIKLVGLELQEAEEIIKIFTVRGALPEPVRIAHLIASGIFGT